MKVKITLLVFILSLGTILPLFKNGLFPIHDNTQAVRVYEMGIALKDGHFPVRWIKNLGYGYGYPLFNFYAPLPYYLGGFIYVVSNDVILSTKIMYGFGIIIAGFGMFILVNEFLGIIPALLSTVLYLYAPYHAVQIYVRGAVGEYWAYGFLPFILWGIARMIKKDNRGIIFTSLFIALLILSHNIISMLFVSLFLLVIILSSVISLFNIEIKIITHKFWISLIVGLMLSSFFWLPALLESRYTSVSQIITGGSQYKDHFLFLDQLWDSPWGFAGSAPGRNDGMSFKVGKLQLILGFSGLLFAYLLKLEKKIQNRDFIFINLILLITLISLFMTLPISQLIWDTFRSFLKFVQFPWRLLVFITFGLSFLSGLVLNFQNRILKFSLAVVLIIVIILMNKKYFQPQTFENLTEKEYLDESYIKWKVSKISDEYLPSNLVRPVSLDTIEKDFIADEEAFQYQIYRSKTQASVFLADIPVSRKITIQKTFFPSWVLYIKGKRVKIFNDHGFISFIAPAGIFKVVLLFKNTLVETIGNLISSITLAGIIFFSFFKYKYEKSYS